MDKENKLYILMDTKIIYPYANVGEFVLGEQHMREIIFNLWLLSMLKHLVHDMYEGKGACVYVSLH